MSELRAFSTKDADIFQFEVVCKIELALPTSPLLYLFISQLSLCSGIVAPFLIVHDPSR
jgi:hypothetical protein